MRTRLLHLWEILTSSYWFVPTVMIAGAVMLALLLLWVDQRWIGRAALHGLFYGGSPEGARALLSTIAGSVITVAGVVFSITIATLTQASSQFGPRLLRNFMRDTGNQLVLGTFVATFVFCLLILRSVRGDGDNIWVPQASVTAAVGLSLASIGVLIYFIHHVSLSLQAPIVVAAVFADLEQAVSEEYPRDMGLDDPDPADDPDRKLPPDFDQRSAPVYAPENGYIQAVDQPTLMETLVEHDLVARLHYRPGDYVVEGAPLLHVWPGEKLDENLCKSFQSMFITGRQRTAEQDMEFAIHQLVEIAVRSLSPGINDPYTAMQCVDRLGSSLRLLAHRNLHRPGRMDEAGRLRVITPISTFRGFVDAAFNQIRQYGRGSVAVQIRMLEVIAAFAPQLRHAEHREPLRRQVEMIYRQARESIHDPDDLRDVEQRYEVAQRALAASRRDQPEKLKRVG